MNLDAIARQCFGQQLGRIAFFLRQEQRLGMDDHRAAAEAAQRLRYLAAHRAATDDKHAFRQRGQVKKCLVGQVAGLVEARNCWQQRTRSGGDQCLLEAQAQAVHVDLVDADKTCRAEEQVDASGRYARR